MKFYDLHIQPAETSLDQIVSTAETLEYSGICILATSDNIERLDKLKSIKTDVKLYKGVLIQAKDANELKKLVDKFREKIDIVIVAGGDYSINRAACENPKVDILAHPEKGRNDNGLDEPCLNSAKKNSVAIEVNFREILHSYRGLRSRSLRNITKNIHLCEAFKVPMILTSGAQSVWDMRAPREVIAIVSMLGMNLGRAFSLMTIIPEKIIDINKKKLEGETITEGVEIVE